MAGRPLRRARIALAAAAAEKARLRVLARLEAKAAREERARVVAEDLRDAHFPLTERRAKIRRRGQKAIYALFEILTARASKYHAARERAEAALWTIFEEAKHCYAVEEECKTGVRPGRGARLQRAALLLGLGTPDLDPIRHPEVDEAAVTRLWQEGKQEINRRVALARRATQKELQRIERRRVRREAAAQKKLDEAP